jgi:hypothetical protein
MFGSHPPSYKYKRQRVTLAYRLFVAVPAKVTDQSKPILRYGVTRYGVVRYTFICRILLHRTVTTQGYLSPNTTSDRALQRCIRKK